ncbi:MAG: aminotransferase class III-fold pyridoxal phosphate-dependent enzyme, partial [Gammaproteobacteria bacterium]|nr:aminotransferase class III-fold pyridoxal phosphate-dependent enzyme [Gammaproteobacteria bacterium]
HAGNMFHIREQTQLARKFCAIAQMERVFFANSGSEANQAAMQIARQHGLNKGINLPSIISIDASSELQARTGDSTSGDQAPPSSTAQQSENIIKARFNDLNAIGEQAENQQVVALMVEPIPSKTGIRNAESGYLKSLRMLCDEHGWLLIFDETESGMGRTGEWFAYQHDAIVPDIMTSARALGNGIPISACATRGIAAKDVDPSTLGGTFAGNPLACQVALATIDVIEQGDLLEAAEVMGNYLKKQIQQHIGTHDKVVDIQGTGMILTLQLDRAYAKLAERLLAAGLVAHVTGEGKVIRLLPAINLRASEARDIAQIIHDVIIQLK